MEQKNSEVEAARVALEEKAEQLALSSSYKSEFLANMSHELRTPLNSLLILARLLTENKDGNLTEKQVEYAQTILGAGSDLLTLINDVLDLSKIEAGKMDINPTDVLLADVKDFVRRSFQPLAEQKGLVFDVEVDGDLPESVRTDGQRLQQVLKNLLSNAFKFTERGRVALTIREAERSRRFNNPALDKADRVIALAVSDTGIGIPRDKQRLIFEAFQQADGTTSRKYGGTGLGLSISREIARLLGGEIRVESTENEGSTFTLFIPGNYDFPEQPGGGSEDAVSTTAPGDWPARQGGSPTLRPRELPERRMQRQELATLGEAPVHDDRAAIEDGRPRGADRRERPQLRAHPAGHGARQGLQGDRRGGRGDGAGARQRVPPGRHHPGHRPAGDRRLDGAGPPQAPLHHAPHPGAHRLRDGKEPARAQAGRGVVPGEAGEQGGAGRRLRRHRPLHRRAGAAACWWWRTTTHSGGASSSWWAATRT